MKPKRPMKSETDPRRRFVAVRADLVERCVPFVSGDIVRYYLNGVCAEPHPDGGVMLVATDGHRLLCVHDAQGRANGTWICRVPAALKRHAVALRRERRAASPGRRGPADRAAQDDWYVFDGARVHLVRAPEESRPNAHAARRDAALTLACPPIDGVYPNWTAVVPDPAGYGGGHAAFNARYVADFARVAPDPAITLFLKGPDHPAIVRFDRAPEMFGLLMPMRGLLADLPPSLPTFAVDACAAAWRAADERKAKAATPGAPAGTEAAE